MRDRRFGSLRVALVEVEGGVELGLAGEQFLEPRLVLEWPVGLGLIVGQRFFQPFDPVPFVLGASCRGRAACVRCSAWCRPDCRD